MMICGVSAFGPTAADFHNCDKRADAGRDLPCRLVKARLEVDGAEHDYENVDGRYVQKARQQVCAAVPPETLNGVVVHCRAAREALLDDQPLVAEQLAQDPRPALVGPVSPVRARERRVAPGIRIAVSQDQLHDRSRVQQTDRAGARERAFPWPVFQDIKAVNIIQNGQGAWSVSSTILRDLRADTCKPLRIAADAGEVEMRALAPRRLPRRPAAGP